jgi:hypothetical protein
MVLDGSSSLRTVHSVAMLDFSVFGMTFTGKLFTCMSCCEDIFLL